MERFTAEQKNEIEMNQFRQFLSTYNKVTEGCFMDCVNDFTSRKIKKEEVDCSSTCVDKYLKMTQRVSLRLQEHFQAQQLTK